MAMRKEGLDLGAPYAIFAAARPAAREEIILAAIFRVNRREQNSGIQTRSANA